MKIGQIIGKDAQSRLRGNAKHPYTPKPRNETLRKRETRRQHRQELETRNWGNHRGCGWNHVVPGGKVIGALLKPAGTADRAIERWTEPDYWVVDPQIGETRSCPNVGPLKANEAACIPSGTRRKNLERKYRGMSWNDAVQHGMLVEK